MSADLELARTWVDHCAEATRTRAPALAYGQCRDGHLALYAPKTRTILVRGDITDAEALVEVLTHEYQHHLDELTGTPCGGSSHGVHGKEFYERLEDLRARVGLWTV